jgi:preprotein translocase subunit Sss1
MSDTNLKTEQPPDKKEYAAIFLFLGFTFISLACLAYASYVLFNMYKSDSEKSKTNIGLVIVGIIVAAVFSILNGYNLFKCATSRCSKLGKKIGCGIAYVFQKTGKKMC